MPRSKGPAPKAHISIHVIHARLGVLGMSFDQFRYQARIGRTMRTDFWRGKQSPRAADLDRMLAVVGLEASYYRAPAVHKSQGMTYEQVMAMTPYRAEAEPQLEEGKSTK